MSSTAEALFGNKPSIERKEAREGFSVSYQIDYKELNFGRELGRGGFGVVHQGTWRTHTDVAIKQLLSDDISPEANEEFETESQIMARLRSPNIVQFYGYCLNPRHCIVMEYMPNGSLYSVLKNTKQPLDWTIRIRIAIDMASGLAFLHQEHIVHRDIKSLNVLLDQSYRAKLTDFGLSKVKTETKSQSMATKTSKDAVGTIAWMAPELFKRKPVYTQKSDIYSLGITFWELAARKIPYSESPQEIIATFVREGEREDIPKDCPQKLASLIAACWEASPDKRPDADAVVTYLKSDKTNFAQFLPLFVSHRASEHQSHAHSTPTVTVHQGNFNSALSGFNNLQVTPPVPKPNFPEQKNPPDRLTQFKEVAKPAFRVSISDLQAFLKLVAEGEQDKAEAMLKKNPDLALVPGDVRDLSKRTFRGITAFQYAVWALDWHMWTMIRKYLPLEAAQLQAEGFETGSWVKTHGVHAQRLLDNLIQAYQTTIDLYNASKTVEGDQAWRQQVGESQRLLPAHVINEYCHSTRPFHTPLPNFKDAVPLPRTRTIEEGEWFTATFNGGKLGETFACYGSDRLFNGGVVSTCGAKMIYGHVGSEEDRWLFYIFCDKDHESVRTLTSARTAQREELITELRPRSDLQVFLRLVAEGEQDKAEAMLKNNRALALILGNVTDLSKRTFTGITAFQYSVWALDWHMWTMIRKYLPDEVAREQARGFETGSWVKSHGIHAQSLLENLIKALQPIIDLCYANKDSALFNSESNTDWIQQANTAWVQQVGGAQRLLPVHVINEYCHPRRPLYPIPNFRDATTLPRTRVGGEWEWFTALSVGAAWGRNGGEYAHAWPGKCAAYSVFSFDLDPDSIRELSSTRAGQREELITQFNSRNTQQEASASVKKLNLSEQKNSSESNMLAQFQGFIKPASRINASDLTAFLRFVVEGEQDKAETMLKSNSALALVPGNVIDLSGRTFTGITAFQYAVWALDWHMWTMMRKYLPIEDARLQVQESEKGHWVKSHGVHAHKLLNDLIKAYKTTIDFYKDSKMGEYCKAWKYLGSVQFLLPAHVVNEYCHSTRCFYPVPNFKDTLTLPRSRTINGINGHNDEGDWFTFLCNNDDAICRSNRAVAAAGPRCVYYQTEHGCVKCEAMETDYESIRVLTSIRTVQHEELIAELRTRRTQKPVGMMLTKII